MFRGVAPDICAEAVRSAVDRQVRRREVFFRQGDPATEGGVLFAGLGKITQTAACGSEVILRLVSPGEIMTLQTTGSHPTSAEALEPSHGLFWSRPVLEGLFDRHPILHRNALLIMTERMRVLEESFGELATERVALRLARALLRAARQIGRPSEHGVVVGLSREDLAHMTGTTMFTVSRQLSAWEADGVVDNRRQAVVIRDPGALNRISAGGAELDGASVESRVVRGSSRATPFLAAPKLGFALP